MKAGTKAAAAVFSRGIMRHRNLEALVGAVPRFRPGIEDAGEVDFVVGWGWKENTRTARAYANAHGLPYVTLEDGFLRSVGLGVAGDPPLSVILDDEGVYYDATRPSRLESILRLGEDRGRLSQGLPRLEELKSRSRDCIDRIIPAQISKYNSAPELELGAADRPRVLLVDQTAGDLSIRHGLAGAASFPQMLEAAVAENPGAEILVKTHPDVIAGKKRGHLAELARERGATLLAEDMNPIRLLEQVDRVYVVTSQMGFEALLAGKPVTCFGAPFYAGWGLTEDRVPIPRRGVRRTLEEVFAAAYILYPRYVDPDSGEPCEIERVIEHLALQRSYFKRNERRFLCLGFTLWKRNYLRDYLRAPGNSIEFASLRTLRRPEAAAADRDGYKPCVVVWGSKETAGIRDAAGRLGADLWRMEDGFIRSPGLGSDLTPPASWVLDRSGIYYDPDRPSDLETLLATHAFAPDLKARAKALRERIVAGRISKYNVGRPAPLEAAAQPGQRRFLLPGQVEDDVSIRLGCRDIRTNADLIRAVRAAHPEAYLIYKPHPDVVSGNRRGSVDTETARLCDQVVVDAGLASCLEAADEVHTLTSLVGFEALMRQLPVATYGLPFYAGWGLTRDRHEVPRRQRRLELDELVAGALILYPRYVNPETGQFTTPEAIVDWLERRIGGSRDTELSVPWLVRQIRKAKYLYRGLSGRR